MTCEMRVGFFMEATNMAGFQAQWAVDEFAGIDLNDNRLNTRAVTIATQLGTIGESSPDAMKGVQQPVKTSPVTVGKCRLPTAR